MLSCVIVLKPLKNGAKTICGQGNARIRRAIVEVDGIAIGGNGIAARKDYVVHIPASLVAFFRAKEPFVNAN